MGAPNYSNNTKEVTLTGPITVTGVSTEAKQDDQIALATSSDNHLGNIENNTGDLVTQMGLLRTSVDEINTGIDDQFITGQGSQTALDRNVINAVAGNGATLVEGFAAAVMQIVPAAGTVTAGSIIFEGSNDNSNFFQILAISYNSGPSTLTSAYNVTAGTQRTVYVPIVTRYIRARISVAITGTTTGVQCFTVLKKSNELVSTVPAAIVQGADAMSNPTVSQNFNYGNLFNGTTWDRWRNNESQTVLASASRAIGTTNTDLVNYNGRGVTLGIDITNVGAAGTLTVKVQVRDAVDITKFVDIPGVTTTAIAATGTYRLAMYPGITTVANAAISEILPRNFRVVATVAGNNVTYSIGAVIQM